MPKNTLKKHIEKITIRRKVITIMILSFLCMICFVYFIFYSSMQSMLRNRENDNIKNQVQLAEDILNSSFSYYPNVIRDWSIWDGTYQFVLGDFDEFLEYYLTDFLYENYSLDFITMLDLNGDVIYERFYPQEHTKNSEIKLDLTEIYSKLGPLTAASFKGDADQAESEQIGVSGFIKVGGELLYMSSYPILRSDKSGPCVGSMIFGRIIYESEMNYLENAPEINFSILNDNDVSLSDEQVQMLEHKNTLVTITNKNRLTAYKMHTNIFGDNQLLISVTSPRYLYKDGIFFITAILAIMILCCIVMLFAIIKLLESIIVKPLTSLVNDVNGIDFESISTSPMTKNKNLEFNILAEAIGNMLTRIRVNRDIIKKKNEELYYNANYDSLTGLRNWVNIRCSLNEIILDARKNNSLIGVFFIDLDRFKYINDTLGHSVGDSFIIAIAQRLINELKQEVAIGRINGGKFIIITGGISDKYKIHLFADEIMWLFEAPFKVKDRELYISASVGSCIYPYDGQDVETLFKNAEISMYHAKELGGNMYCRYQSEMDKVLQRKVYIENKLRSAINDGCRQFRAYFQPKVLSKTGEIPSCEALIRWDTPEGIIGPNEFIPLAEESGLILPLSRWMLKEACRCNKLLEEQGIYNTVSVNISAQVLLHKEFINMIKEAVSETGANIKRLDIEITEATLVEDIIKVNSVLNTLHELGITISIDDFGTGYSSLSYLKKLSVDRIKIDKSFIIGLNDNEEDRTIVNAIVAMAKSLHMIITAEGVEDVMQYTYLKSIECEEIQGYYISRPLPYEEFIIFRKDWCSTRKIN